MSEDVTPLEALEAAEAFDEGQSDTQESQSLNTLQEFGEVPIGFRSVFVRIQRESLEYVAQNGLSTADNRMTSKNQVLEGIFQEAATEAGIGVNRAASIFAYPRRPEGAQGQLVNTENTNVTLEIKVDPSKALVTDGEFYTRAWTELDSYQDTEAASEWARDYWQGAKTLAQYLAEGHSGSRDDWNDFTAPEVLIPDDVPVEHIRIA